MAGRNTEYKMAIRIAGEIDKTFPKSIQMSKAELRAIAKEAAQAEKEFSRTSKQIGKGLFDASALKETKGFFTAIEKAGVKAFKAIGKASATAVGAVGAFSVKTGMDYEKQMSSVKAVSKASESEFKMLSDEAKRIGATTASTAKEAGEAMEYEAMAGWKPNQIVAATSAIVDLKQSSEDLDLGTTSDILTDAITAFKMKAEDATHLADVMAATSTSANTDVAMMGESFKYAAPMAGSMGYSAEDTALTLGLMANAGVKSSMAGTTERNWIKRMVKPTKESEEAMKKLHLSTKDSDGKSKSLLQITEDTRKAFAKIKDKDDKSKYAAMLAGAQGMSGLLAIVNASEKDFKNLKKSIYDCDGAAKELAAIKLDNLEGDVTLFTSAMQGAGVDIYEEIKEPLRDLVQGATEWVGDFSKEFKTAFPTIVRESKEIGEAIGDFAEPLLEIGGWMLDNPEVIAGTIAGIGSAIVAYKVVEGVTALETAIGGLTKASLPILGLTAAVGVIGGLGTAIAISAKEAKEASLDEHFGNIALSMEEVQEISKEIVGAKKLKQVDELFQSLGSIENVAKEIEEARKVFNTTEWKLTAGLTVSDSDMKSFESSVKGYVEKSQELIDEKGYEVNVATKVLLGDSEEGKKLINDNNKFFAKLNEEASGLSKEINKKLKKAMKNGLTLDLQEEIDGLLSQLSDITNAITEAENESSWELMSAQWSGKELDADSFKNLAKEVESNIETLNEGADTAYAESVRNLLARKKLGDISEKEYASEKKILEENYDAMLQDSKDSAVDFLYNTMMDTYGQTIASGQYEDGDKNAIREMISYIEEFEPDFQMSKDLNSIILAMNQNGLTDFNSWLGSVPGNMDKDIYANADKESKQIAQAYLDQKAFEEAGVDVADATQEFFDMYSLDFGKFIEKPAEEAGKNASDNMKNKFISDMSSGVTAQFPITLKGSYTMYSGSLSPTEQKDVKSASSVKNEKFSFKDLNPTPYALGGIATEPTLLVAEAGSSEAVIPLDGSARSVNLWEQTGRLLGAEREGKKVKSFSELLSELSALPSVGGNRASYSDSDGTFNFTYAPNITIQGNPDQGVAQTVVSIGYDEFVKLAKKWEKDKKRSSF